MLPWGGRISEFSEFFLRCICSPAGGTYFQKSDFSKLFLRCLGSPAGGTYFQKSDTGLACVRLDDVPDHSKSVRTSVFA